MPVTIAVLDNDTHPDVPSREQTLLVSTVTQPAGGEGIVTTDHIRVIFTPSPSFTSGALTFTYTVDDGLGGTAIGTVSVTMPDGAPEAADDFAGTDYLTPVTVDVLANDSDDNGEALTIHFGVRRGARHHDHQRVGPAHRDLVHSRRWLEWHRNDDVHDDRRNQFGRRATSSQDRNGSPTAPDFSAVVHVGQANALKVLDHASDPNGDRLTVTTFSGTAHAELSVSTDGVVTYAPDPAYVGPDSFNYTVDDGHGGRASGTITLEVVNHAPVAFDDDSVDVANSEWTTLDVLANDTDPDGDPLTILWAYATTYGTSEGPRGQVDVIAGRTRLEFLSAPHGRGPNAITYAISDGHGGTDFGLALVNVGNAPPETYDYNYETSHGDVSSTYHVFEHTKDDNQDPLTLVDAGGAAHGRVDWTADGGVVVYTPDLRFAGDDSFTYTVIDDHGGSVTGTVRIHVMAELHVDDDSDSTDSGVPVTVDVAANDTPGEYGVLVLTSLTLLDPADASTTTQHRTVPGVGAFDVIPGGNITFTPKATFSGVVTVPYRLSEIATRPGEGSGFPRTLMDTADLTITVTAVGDPPDPTSDPTIKPARNPTTAPAHRGGSDLADTGGPTLALIALGLCSMLGGSTLVLGRRRGGRHE